MILNIALNLLFFYFKTQKIFLNGNKLDREVEIGVVCFNLINLNDPKTTMFKNALCEL